MNADSEIDDNKDNKDGDNEELYLNTTFEEKLTLWKQQDNLKDRLNKPHIKKENNHQIQQNIKENKNSTQIIKTSEKPEKIHNSQTDLLNMLKFDHNTHSEVISYSLSGLKEKIAELSDKLNNNQQKKHEIERNLEILKYKHNAALIVQQNLRDSMYERQMDYNSIQLRLAWAIKRLNEKNCYLREFVAFNRKLALDVNKSEKNAKLTNKIEEIESKIDSLIETNQKTVVKHQESTKFLKKIQNGNNDVVKKLSLMKALLQHEQWKLHDRQNEKLLNNEDYQQITMNRFEDAENKLKENKKKLMEYEEIERKFRSNEELLKQKLASTRQLTWSLMGG